MRSVATGWSEDWLAVVIGPFVFVLSLGVLGVVLVLILIFVGRTYFPA